jgi:transcriptional regulator with XRE-family HTH domain
MNFIQVRLADTLKRQRALLGLTQEDLAALTGLSSGFIGNIEAGKKWPSAGSLEKLGKALGIDPGTFFADPAGTEHKLYDSDVVKMIDITLRKAFGLDQAEEAAEKPSAGTPPYPGMPENTERQR